MNANDRIKLARQYHMDDIAQAIKSLPPKDAEAVAWLSHYARHGSMADATTFAKQAMQTITKP